jgi:hypothetical protein
MIGSKAKGIAFSLLSTWAALAPTLATGTPLDQIAPGDPLEEEIRVLEVSGVPLRLPRLGMRPLQVVDLPALDQPLPGVAEIARRRLLRSLARDRGLTGVPGATPRLVQATFPDDQRFEVSAGIEGEGSAVESHEPQLKEGSGARARFGAQVGRWLAFADVGAGKGRGAGSYSNRILRSDAALFTDLSYVSYTGASERWGAWLGRGRWQWGPGEEASLMLSRTSPAYTSLVFRMRIEPLRADGMILSATLRGASGAQLAAHRLEWQPRDDLRLGVSEAARYRASSWQPLYVVGVIPYALVQSLLVKDEPDSGAALRNNVAAGLDAAWRVLPGTRLHGELLIDDLRTEDVGTLSKYAYQLGWEGVGTVRGSRVHWSTEYTRLTRFVYTSFYDRAFTVAGEPLGFPTGPDSRRLRVRATWDPSVAWQVFASAVRTDRGESGLETPFFPGSPPVPVARFAGTVETTREFEAGLRWWPASGIDVRLSVGSRRIENLGHEAGEDRSEPFTVLGVRLLR